MKTILKSAVVIMTICFCCYMPQKSSAQDQVVTSLQTFYDQLAPYGQWVQNPTYGWVFYPNAGPGFVPYSTSGHWVYNDDFGWTWASDYQWGWACFHYGRWNYDPSYGWFWVPDLNWGPAWVAWRNSDDYYGWAPLPSGVDISVGFGDGIGINANFWSFVPAQYIADPNVCNYYAPRANNDIYYAHTAFINRTHYDRDRRYRYYGGPERREVEEHYHQQIQPATVNYYTDPRQSYNPGSNQINIYRPANQINNVDNRNNYAPAQHVTENDLQQRDPDHHYYDYHQDYHNYNYGDRDHGNGDHHWNNGNRGNDNDHGNNGNRGNDNGNNGNRGNDNGNNGNRGNDNGNNGNRGNDNGNNGNRGNDNGNNGNQGNNGNHGNNGNQGNNGNRGNFSNGRH